MLEAKTYAPGSTAVWQIHPEDFSREELRQLHRYWLDLGGESGIPRRSDLDIMRLKPVLGNIVILEYVRSEQRYRYRLVGTNIVERDGFDWTGRYLDTVPVESYRNLILRRIEEVASRRTPLLVRNKQMFDGRWYDYECLWLPLTLSDGSIDLFLACQVHFLPPPQAERQ